MPFPRTTATKTRGECRRRPGCGRARRWARPSS